MKLRLVALSLILATGCAPAPPNLTPAGVAAFKGTQAIKALDMLRDAAVDANALTPPLISTDSTRRVVLYHKSAITIIHKTPGGWRPTVGAGLGELRASLKGTDGEQLAPYIHLAQTLIEETR